MKASSIASSASSTTWCSTWCARASAPAIAALLVAAAPAAAQTGAETWFDLPLAGGARTLAFLEIEAAERADTFPLVARILYGNNESRAVTSLPRLREQLRTASAADAGESLTIPVPLSRAAWQSLPEIEGDADLSTRLLTDRNATLLAAGFATTHPSIRVLALRDPDWLRRLYATAGAFAVAARSLRVEDGAVVVPGGAAARPIWGSLAAAPPGEPQAFIAALLAKDGGRLAWFFDCATRAGHGVDAGALEALYEGFRAYEPRWRLEEHPFRRTAADPAAVWHLVETNGTAVAGPPWRWFWDTLFTGRPGGRSERPATLPWVAQAIAAAPAQERRDRFEMLRLAQRVFPSPSIDEAGELLTALGAYRSHRALLLTLERMGIRDPATWATVVGAARHVDRAGGDRRAALIAFQGAIALVARAAHAGSIDAAEAGSMLRLLSDRVRGARQVPAAVKQWIGKTWCCDASVIDAVAGPPPAIPRTLVWEGLTYTVDAAAAERERLARMLRVLGAGRLEDALKSADQSALTGWLLTFTYALALGDPAGAITFARELPGRHDFALRAPQRMGAALTWGLAVERQGIGRTWHVQGSLLGLDLALARLAMRHVGAEAMPLEPTLSLNDFATFARTAIAMQPRRLSDVDRDELAAALARGRERAPRGAFVPLRDLLWLGRPQLPAARLDDWGLFAQALDGRLTLAMPHAADWQDFAGRSDTGQLSTQLPDLTLRLAEETARLQLPASLVPALLAAAVPEYWYGVRARFSDDYAAMARAAAALRPERVEDYVAALAGTGPLRSP